MVYFCQILCFHCHRCICAQYYTISEKKNMNFEKVYNFITKLDNLNKYYLFEKRIQGVFIYTIFFFLTLFISIFIDYYIRSVLNVKLNLFGLLGYYLCFLIIFLMILAFLCGLTFLFIEKYIKNSRNLFIKNISNNVDKIEAYVKDKVIAKIVILIVTFCLMKNVHFDSPFLNFIFIFLLLLSLFPQLSLLLRDLILIYKKKYKNNKTIRKLK